MQKPYIQFTCAKCSLRVKTGEFTYFYAASTSRRKHPITCNKARKSQVISLGGFRQTYLQFAAYLQLFLPVFANIFTSECYCFCLQIAFVFACKSRQLCMPVVGKFASVPLLKLPVKYPLDSGKFICCSRQFACIVREVLAA